MELGQRHLEIAEAIMSEPPDEVVARGLMRFYSSQAEVMLAQYRNINDLLGPTSHHTHPGTHCEVLLRNCIRQFLPPSWSADKGFIFGRVERDGESAHSPEIDILIHDMSVRRPLFRLDDFVIVHPKAFVGAVQVKASISSRRLKVAIKNVVDAKQHLLDLWRSKDTKKLYLDRMPFSAVIGFDGALSESSLKACLQYFQTRHRSFEQAWDAPWKTSALVLPDLIGSLSGQIAVADNGADKRGYSVFDSVCDEINIAVQLLLWSLGRRSLSPQPLSFPTDLKPLATFKVDG
jgi:hypothetical protein